MSRVGRESSCFRRSLVISTERGPSFSRSSFLHPFMMNTKSVVPIALAWRILRSSQRAHEFYQSLEVAHHAIFGYGPSHLGMVDFTSNPKCLLPLGLHASLLAFEGYGLG